MKARTKIRILFELELILKINIQDCEILDLQATNKGWSACGMA